MAHEVHVKGGKVVKTVHPRKNEVAHKEYHTEHGKVVGNKVYHPTQHRKEMVLKKPHATVNYFRTYPNIAQAKACQHAKDALDHHQISATLHASYWTLLAAGLTVFAAVISVGAALIAL